MHFLSRKIILNFTNVNYFYKNTSIDIKFLSDWGEKFSIEFLGRNVVIITCVHEQVAARRSLIDTYFKTYSQLSDVVKKPSPNQKFSLH